MTHSAGTDKPRSPSILYIGTLLFSAIFSLGGIVYGATHNPNNGGRGGALAVAVAFAALFGRSTFSKEIYKATAETLPGIHRHMREMLENLKHVHNSPTLLPELSTIRDQISGILFMLDAAAVDQSRQNVCIAAASVIGTLAWGFGDLAAAQIHLWLAKLTS